MPVPSRSKRQSCIEQGFNWAKTVGGIRQVMVRAFTRVDQMFVLTCGRVQLGAHAHVETKPPAGAISG